MDKPSATAGRSGRRALRDDEEASGGLNTSETLAAGAGIFHQFDLRYVDHLAPTIPRLGRHARCEEEWLALEFIVMTSKPRVPITWRTDPELSITKEAFVM